MVYLSTCALVFFWMAATQPGESLASEQAIFKRNEQKYLADHVIETKQAGSEVECGMHCVANKSCTSINYKTSGIGKGRCELNNKIAEETSSVDDKIHDPEFNHLAVIKRVVSLQLKICFNFRGCLHCFGADIKDSLTWMYMCIYKGLMIYHALICNDNKNLTNYFTHISLVAKTITRNSGHALDHNHMR